MLNRWQSTIVDAQTQLFISASQALVGKRQRLRDLVHEAQTPEDLEAIHWGDPPAS